MISESNDSSENNDAVINMASESQQNSTSGALIKYTTDMVNDKGRLFKNLTDLSNMTTATLANVYLAGTQPWISALVTCLALSHSYLSEAGHLEKHTDRLNKARENLGQPQVKQSYSLQRSALMIGFSMLILYGILTGLDIDPKLALASIIMATVLPPLARKANVGYISYQADKAEAKVKEIEEQAKQEQLNKARIRQRANILLEENEASLLKEFDEDNPEHAQLEQSEESHQVELPEQHTQLEQSEEYHQVELPEQHAQLEQSEEPHQVELPEQHAQLEQSEEPHQVELPEQHAQLEQPGEPQQVEQPEQHDQFVQQAHQDQPALANWRRQRASSLNERDIYGINNKNTSQPEGTAEQTRQRKNSFP